MTWHATKWRNEWKSEWILEPVHPVVKVVALLRFCVLTLGGSFLVHAQNLRIYHIWVSPGAAPRDHSPRASKNFQNVENLHLGSIVLIGSIVWMIGSKRRKGIGITWILHGISHGLERCYFWMTTTSDRDLTARLSSDRACGGAICTGAKTTQVVLWKWPLCVWKVVIYKLKCTFALICTYWHMHVYACMIMCWMC